MKRFILVRMTSVLVCLGAFVAATQGEEDPWQTNFKAAQEQAAKEGKDLLVNFTGSDWCGWCISLDKEVFSEGVFQNFAKDHLVLVKCDFPRKWQHIPVEVRDQNVILKKKYGVKGFPAIIILDGKGMPYARTGYQKGGPEAYLKHLGELQAIREKRDAAWKQAETATGVEKAIALAEGLTTLEEGLVIRNYMATVEEILTLDPQDATGIGKKDWVFKAKRVNLEDKVKELDRVAAFKVIDEFITEHKLTGPAAQDIQMIKLGLFSSKSVADFDSVIKLMDEIIAIEPNSVFAGGAANVKSQVATRKKKLEEEAAKKAEIQKVQETLAKLTGELEKAEGLDRAKVLDQMVDVQAKLSQNVPSPEAAEWSKEIVLLDTDNKAGLKTKYELRDLLANATKHLKAKDPAKARAALDEALALPGLTEEQKAALQQSEKQLQKQKPEQPIGEKT